MTITFEQFSSKVAAAGESLEANVAKITLAGTKGLADHVAGSYKLASGGDGRLSGTGRARNTGRGFARGGSGAQAPISAKAKDVLKYGGDYVGLVVPTGPYGLIERDIAPHVISPFGLGSGRGSRRNRRVAKVTRAAARVGQSARGAAVAERARIDAAQGRALAIPGSPNGYAASANHPGTRGKNVFSRSVATGGPVQNRKMLDETIRQMQAGYAGRA
ncbi:MAG: hypothetical protein WKF86_00135 [Acidimicrobiales bacterium]